MSPLLISPRIAHLPKAHPSGCNFMMLTSQVFHATEVTLQSPHASITGEVQWSALGPTVALVALIGGEEVVDVFCWIREYIMYMVV